MAEAGGGTQDMGRVKGESTPRFVRPWMRIEGRPEWLRQKGPELIERKPPR